MSISLDRAMCAAVIACTMIAHGSAGARDRDIDYYNPGPDAGVIRGAEGRHLELGVRRMQDPKWDRYNVWAEFNFMLRTSPNHPRALDLMVRLCATWKNPRCVLDDYFDKAIAINPRVSSTYVLKGIYQARFDRPKLAVESFKAALEIEPDSVNAHYNLGLSYFDLKDYARSNEHAQKAYALGVPLPGLRNKLQAVGRWDPSARSSLPPVAPTLGVPEAKGAAPGK